MNIIEINKNNFDEIVQKNRFVVLDFSAEWCAPCKSFAKTIEKTAKQYPEFIFGKIDIDQEKELSEEFEIRSIPAVMIIRDKVVVFAETGALSPSALTDLLKQTKALDLKDQVT